MLNVLTKVKEPGGATGCLLQPLPEPLPGGSVSPGPPPDHVGGGGCLSLLHRLNRTTVAHLFQGLVLRGDPVAGGPGNVQSP